MVNSNMENGYLNSLASIGTPRARREKSSYIQRSLSSKKKDDVLDSFVTNNATASASSYSILETHLSMDITVDLTIMSVAEEEGAEVGSMLQEFLDFFLSYPGEHEVFNLLSCYEELCSERVKSLISVINKVPAQQKIKKTEVLNTFQNERNTWRILNTLYKDRIEKEAIDDEEMPMDTVGRKLSDRQLIDNLFLRNSRVRQSQLVIDWLEKNAAEDFAYKYYDKLEYFSENSVSWEHTLHNLTLCRSQMDIRPTRDCLITELDPDAPIRQRNNVLHNTDKENEMRLLKYMFVCIRAGELEKAQEVAEKFGQSWLAASLEGWKPFHDPNYDGSSDGSVLLPVEGNRYRDIWKASCWRTSQEPRISVFEQAVYGVFSGNLKPILKACENWEDCLWAYLRVFVDKIIEQELRSNTQTERPLEELPAEYWDRHLELNQIFQELNAFPSEVVQTEGKNPFHVIQKYIILDDIDGLIEEFYTWVRCDQRPPAHLLRLMTHIILFLRMVGRSTKEELCVAIIESYVRELIDQHKIALVASYTSTLPPSHQVIWYAKFLEGVTDNTERQFCLKFAEEAGLNIPIITKTVVENTRNRLPAEIEASGMTIKVTTEDDRQKIEAIDWLVFDQAQRAEAIKQANALMREFVANEKLDAARQVFAKIPSDSINVILKQSRMSGLSEPSAEDDNATREHICFRTYLEAVDAFNDWFQHFQNAKPKRPELPSGTTVKFKEKVAHEHELKLYELELGRWENCLMSQTKTTTDRLYNVLLFISGGWMVDQRTEEPIDENRQRQMSILRKLCIPQITNLLHNVLYNTNQSKASVQLADIIASERYQLYKEFNIQQLRQLLSTLRESSLALLGGNLDPLGYPIQ